MPSESHSRCCEAPGEVRIRRAEIPSLLKAARAILKALALSDLRPAWDEPSCKMRRAGAVDRAIRASAGAAK
jgi:hypothetical protein